MKKFAKKLLASPNTSGTGLAGLITVGLGAVVHPAILLQPDNIAVILVSLGLLCAKDEIHPK